MTVHADSRTIGAFVYFGADPATHKEMPSEAVRVVLDSLAMPLRELKMSVFKTPFKEGRWRTFQWKAAQAALDDPEVEVLNVRLESSEGLFTAKFQVRSDPDPQRAPLSPRRFYFACDIHAPRSGAETDAARALLRVVANLASPISGGVICASTFPQAYCEVEDGADRDSESAEFKERIRVDRRFETDRWTKARRLYPITLLGPKLASQVSAADALAAGALSVQELNGSLLIDAYPSVVETWDPEYLRATVTLRKWLWPLTIQNPADAVGLGLKLPKR